MGNCCSHLILAERWIIMETMWSLSRNVWIMCLIFIVTIWSPATTWCQESFLERFPILCRDEIVDDWIDGGVEIQEESGDIHQVLIGDVIHLLRHPVEPRVQHFIKKTSNFRFQSNFVLMKSLKRDHFLGKRDYVHDLCGIRYLGCKIQL